MIEGKWPWPTPLLVNNRFGFDYLCAEVGKGKWISPSYFPLKDRVWELHGRLGRKVSLCSDTCRKDIWSILAAVVFNNYLTYTRALFVGTRKPWGGGRKFAYKTISSVLFTGGYVILPGNQYNHWFPSDLGCLVPFRVELSYSNLSSWSSSVVPFQKAYLLNDLHFWWRSGIHMNCFTCRRKWTVHRSRRTTRQSLKFCSKSGVHRYWEWISS